MLNQQKIRLMTKAAAFEERERKDDFEVNRYFRGDYVSLGMIKSAIGITIGTVVVVLFWAFINMEELLTATDLAELLALGERILFYYVAAMVLHLFLTFLVCQVRYHAMEKRMEKYVLLLKRIEKLNEADKRDAAREEEISQ